MAKKPKTPEIPFGDNLILFRYFLDQFGRDSLSRLAGELNNVEYEGVNDSGNTYFYDYLSGLPTLKVSKDTLKVYDENICRYFKQIGGKRRKLLSDLDARLIKQTRHSEIFIVEWQIA